MSKYIAIKGDHNDGDTITEITVITDEEEVKVKELLAKMPRFKNWLGEVIPCIRYETLELGNDDKPDSNYDFISNEEKKLLGKFLPRGDDNYQGIHTIESVIIFEKIEELL